MTEKHVDSEIDKWIFMATENQLFTIHMNSNNLNECHGLRNTI